MFVLTMLMNVKDEVGSESVKLLSGVRRECKVIMLKDRGGIKNELD